MNNIIIYSIFSILIVVHSSSASPLEGKWRSTKSSSYYNFSAEGKFEGYDGCNEIWGTWRISNDSLILSDVSGTLIACTGPQVVIELPSSGPYTVSNDTLLIFNATQSYKYYKQVSTSVNAPLQPTVMRTHYSGINSEAIIFYDITGRRIGSSPSTGIISRSSGILLRRDKNGYSIMAHMSDK
jgi:hypothetical protein